MLKRGLLCLSVLLAFAMPSAAAGDKLRNALQREVARQKLPGLAFVIVRGDAPPKFETFGYANLEWSMVVRPDTRFQAGSTAKQFTALAILLLEREGKVHLDDRLGRFFPDAPPGWQALKLRDLLTHTAGIEDEPARLDLKSTLTSAALRAIIWRMPLRAPPGARFRYSDMGYVLLGMVIEEVTGAPYHRYLDRHLFQPLGMADTRSLSDRDVVLHRAAGYEGSPTALMNQDWVSPPFNATADGSTYISARDAARWLAVIDRPPAWLRAPLAQTLQPTPLTDGLVQPYGMGWFVTTAGGEPIQFHTGSWQGFRAVLVRYPRRRFAFAMYSNADFADLQTLANVALRIIDPTLPPLPRTASLTPVVVVGNEKVSP